MKIQKCGMLPVWVPVPCEGDRVEIIAGQFKGRHGTLSYLKDTLCMVKTDGGIEVELRLDHISAEKEQPKEIVPDIKCGDGLFPPEMVHEWQEAFERAGKMLLKRGELCANAGRRCEMRELGGRLMQISQEAQRKFQAWSIDNGPSSWRIITRRLQEIISERERQIGIVKDPKKLGTPTVVSWDKKASVVKHLHAIKEKGLSVYQHKQCLVVKDPQEKVGDFLGVGGVGGKFNASLGGWIFPISKAEETLRRVAQAIE